MQQCPSCAELVPVEYVVCVWCGYDLTGEHIRRAGIVINRKEAFMRMRDIVIDPLNAAKKITLIPDLHGGRIIFYLIGFMMTLNMLAVFSKLDGAEFNNATEYPLISAIQLTRTILLEPTYTMKFVVGVLFLIVQPIVLFIIFNLIWKYAAKIILAIARSLGGHGDQMKIRSALGYSMLPVLIGWTLSWLMTLMASPVTLPGSIDYTSISEAVVEVTRSGMGLVGFIFIIIGWVWAIVLSVITIRQAVKVSIFESIIIAGIPSAFFMTIVVFGTEFLS
ncbi:MAG: YIP1 family protein [Candidatus Heimdallarchaeota archaeon]|nr:YIP1 family protein [Candidatus Heimdallarchaeota archaeon]